MDIVITITISNSEADALELLNLEEMFPRYYMDSDTLSTYLNIHSLTYVLPVAK